MMPEILTESFCERCGTRYTFEATAPAKVKKLGKFKTLSKGLKNYVLSDENSLDEAMAAARSDEERELTGHQLEAFQATFNFCMTCRQYTCANCWNAAEGACLTCAPLNGQFALNGHDAIPTFLRDLAPAVTDEPHPVEASPWPMSDASKDEAAAPTLDAASPEMAAEAWPIEAEQAARSEDTVETAAEADWVAAEAEAEADPTIPADAERAVHVEGHTFESDIAPVVAELAAVDERAAAAARRTSELLAKLRPAAGVDAVSEAVEAPMAPMDAPTIPVDESVAAEIADIAAESAANELAAAELAAAAAEADLAAEVAAQAELAAAAAQADIAAEAAAQAEFEAAAAEAELAASAAAELAAQAAEAEIAAAAAEANIAAEAAAQAEFEAAAAEAELAAQAAAAELAAQAAEAEIAAAAAEADMAAQVAADAAAAEVEIAAAAAEAELSAQFAAAEPDVADAVAAAPWPDERVDALPPDLLAVIGPAIEAAPEPVDELVAESLDVAATAPVEPEPESEAVRADVVEQPTWRIVAPEPAITSTNGHTPTPAPEPVLPPVAAQAPVAPVAPVEPQWPAPPESPVPQADPSFLVSRRTSDASEGLWAASARGVMAHAPGTPAAVIQTCGSCGLSLSATARFCRRCGTRQGA